MLIEPLVTMTGHDVGRAKPARKSTYDTRSLREHLISVQGWITHWRRDAECNLPCTEASLDMAAFRIEQSLSALDYIEAEELA